MQSELLLDPRLKQLYVSVIPHIPLVMSVNFSGIHSICSMISVARRALGVSESIEEHAYGLSSLLTSRFSHPEVTTCLLEKLFATSAI